MNFDILSLLPMLPWEGPPLPRLFGLSWPWAQQAGQSGTPALKMPQIFRSVEASGQPALPALPQVLYSNTEELKVVRGEDGGIDHVIRHIRVTKGE